MDIDKSNIFISYSRIDSEFALRLSNDLKAKGVNAWLDQTDIDPGNIWDSEVERALKTSEKFLIILTPDSVVSQSAMDELNYAIEEKKKIIPVLLKECDIPFRIRRRQHIDFSKDYEAGLSILLKSFSVQKQTTIHTATGKTNKDNIEAELKRKQKEERKAKEQAELKRKLEEELKAKEKAEQIRKQGEERKVKEKDQAESTHKPKDLWQKRQLEKEAARQTTQKRKTILILLSIITITIIVILIWQPWNKKTNKDVVINPEFGYFIDSRDQVKYKTVKIGNQTWMAENLKATKYNDGNAIPLVTEATDWSKLKTAGYCWYNNNEAANKNTYGALYNWHAVNTGKLCPTGWHVPTDNEWKQLEMNLGMSKSMADHINWRGTDEGKKLKSTTGWNLGGNGTDKAGFTALPGGDRSDGGHFYNLGDGGFWWSATEYGSNGAWGRYLIFDTGAVPRYGSKKVYGFSVRCVRD